MAKKRWQEAPNVRKAMEDLKKIFNAHGNMTDLITCDCCGKNESVLLGIWQPVASLWEELSMRRVLQGRPPVDPKKPPGVIYGLCESCFTLPHVLKIVEAKLIGRRTVILDDTPLQEEKELEFS